MMRLRRLPGLPAAAALWVIGAVAPAAHASPPPQPGLSHVAAPWLGYVFMVVLLALVLGVSLMPARRGHQD
jgi:FtsH-binding integral membrane protein